MVQYVNVSYTCSKIYPSNVLTSTKTRKKTAGEIGHGLINNMLLPPAFGMHRSTAKFGAPNFALLKLTQVYLHIAHTSAMSVFFGKMVYFTKLKRAIWPRFHLIFLVGMALLCSSADCWMVLYPSIRWVHWESTGIPKLASIPSRQPSTKHPTIQGLI